MTCPSSLRRTGASWVAVRVFASAHTNPVFVGRHGRPIRASKKSAQWCLDAVDVCWKAKSPKIRESEREAAAAAYEKAREAYRAILAEAEKTLDSSFAARLQSSCAPIDRCVFADVAIDTCERASIAQQNATFSKMCLHKSHKFVRCCKIRRFKDRESMLLASSIHERNGELRSTIDCRAATTATLLRASVGCRCQADD